MAFDSRVSPKNRIDTMKLDDVRRITGSHLLMDRTGAAAEIEGPAKEIGVAVAIWRQQMRQLLDDIGWSAEIIVARAHEKGASVAISAHVDCLYVACDVLESGWARTERALSGSQLPDIKSETANLIRRISDDADQNLRDVVATARKKGLTFLDNDGQISVGLGAGRQIWSSNSLPLCSEIDWNALNEVPVAMVTGTNGKSTTVRVSAAIGAAAGYTVGLCSSDWVRVGDAIVDEGDYSGPSGASLAVRSPDVGLAVLEVARGGLMRRGLTIEQADVCVVTNVTPDHLGTYGITDVQSLADAKFVLAKAVKQDGCLVLNADDPLVVERSVRFAGNIVWYGLSIDRQSMAGWLKAGGTAAFVENEMLMLASGEESFAILAIDDFEPALKGAAAYNVSNALAAIGLAAGLGLPVEAMTEGLSEFKNSPEQNPGRGNLMDVGGVNLMVDFAHNPEGVEAVLTAVASLPASRRLVIIGQAGDRRDEDIQELVRKYLH